MKFYIGIFVFLYGVSGAHAFQETEVPVTSSPEVKSHSTENGRKLDLDLPDETGSVKSSKGTTIYIPGLGTLGTLPDLNFGLELLYNDDKKDPIIDPNNEDVTIKGRLKHNF